MRSKTPSRALQAAIATALVALFLHTVPAAAATAEVQIGDDFFNPRSIRIDPGDTVTWDGGGLHPHTVTSDTGLFDSGDMRASSDFSFTFEKEGAYYYHCRFHGRPQKGMWGVVIVGDLPKDQRDKLFVPDDYPTIQDAVDAAEPGTLIIVRPGTYEESVVVTTDRLTIRGDDRFRTVIDGGDSLPTGIHIDGAEGTIVKRLTVRDFTDTGITIEGADGFAIKEVDSIFNRRFGIWSLASRSGTVADSFLWGSGEAGIQIGPCFACGMLVDKVRARRNLIGLEILNATGVTVRGSRLTGNGVGLLARSDGNGGPGRGLYVVYNTIVSNNLETIPPVGDAATHGYPFGTGVWLAGVSNTTIIENSITGHARYGVLVTHGVQNELEPVNNRTVRNWVHSTDGALDLAWDGGGTSNCFDDDDVATSGPPVIQALYPCDARPFEGEDYPPVREDVDAAIAAGPRTDTQKPPEPKRPR